MYILLRLATVYKVNNLSSLVKRILGYKAAKLLDTLIIINGLGAFTVYFVISKNINLFLILNFIKNSL